MGKTITTEVRLPKTTIDEVKAIAKLAGLSPESVIKLAMATELRRWKKVGSSETARPVAWIRFCSDGSYEGPIADCDKRMDDTRRKSGAWTPLYTHNAGIER